MSNPEQTPVAEARDLKDQVRVEAEEPQWVYDKDGGIVGFLIEWRVWEVGGEERILGSGHTIRQLPPD